MKSYRINPSLPGVSRTRARRKRITILAVSILALTGIVTVSFLVGTAMLPKINEAAKNLGMPDEGRRKAILAGPGNYMSSLFSAEQPEKLLIDIKFNHMKKLRATRDEALELDVLNSTGQDFVPATIRYLDRSIRVALRLKGDNTDHLQGDKWSFLVKVKGGDQLFGMRRFSLMNPRVREDQYEPLAFVYMRDLGLLAPKYMFVDLTINGKRIGIMALEEYPAKELLESQGRRESVIVRFDESQVWDDYAYKGYFDDDFNNYMTVPIRVAQEGKVRKSESLSRDMEIATGLLKSYIRGVLPASQVFDVEEYGRFLAALEVLGVRNGIWWGNWRFYYNPISARLEPVSSDLMSEYRMTSAGELYNLHSMDLRETREILADPDIRRVFVRELRRLTSDVEDGSTEAFLKPFEQKFRTMLHRDLPLLTIFDFDRLRSRAAHLSKVTLENLDYFNHLSADGHAFLLNAEVMKDGQKGKLELTNIVGAPVEVISIGWRGESGDALVPISTYSPFQFPIELIATGSDVIPEVTQLLFSYPPDLVEGSRIEIVARIKGTDRTYHIEAVRSFDTVKTRPIPTETLSELLDHHHFLRLSSESVLSVVPGYHLVSDTISIPPGYELRIPAGTTLSFKPDASLVVWGPLNINGTPEQPVILDEQVSSDGHMGWQGIVVMNADKQSLWKYAQIRNTTGVRYGAWQLTGGVTFYQSNVRFEQVSLVSSRAEDALNIIRSDFVLKDLLIMDTVSDGFDSDYSRGIVEGGLFENIGTAGGGDAIDISGSTVSVSDTEFHKINDKALSVGEGSQMNANGVHIDGALTGAASKDASRLNITSSTISNARIAGLMAYVKKPEYGSATINAVDIQFEGTSANALVQTGSKIQIDGESISPTELDVDALYDSFMKKAQR